MKSILLFSAKATTLLSLSVAQYLLALLIAEFRLRLRLRLRLFAVLQINIGDVSRHNQSLLFNPILSNLCYNDSYFLRRTQSARW